MPGRPGEIAPEEIPYRDAGPAASMGRVPEGKAGESLRGALAARLAKTTGQQFSQDRQKWIAWFSKEHPFHAKRLSNPDGVDVADWTKRLTQVDWDKGDVKRGQMLFVKALCGVSWRQPGHRSRPARHSRSLLRAAICSPRFCNRARTSRRDYQTTVIETDAGKIFRPNYL